MADKLTREQLENILSDLRDEPEWRARANMAEDYYDGNQLDSDTLQIMRERNQPPLIRNSVAPIIDLVLGMEAKNKRDWKVGAEADLDFQMSLAANALIKKHERASNADRACSDAYAQQVKAGLGWVEVGRNPNVMGSRYRVCSVDWREIYWDWRAKENDLSDARYLTRQRWLDLDVAKLYFPGKAKALEEAGKGWADWDMGADGNVESSTLLDFSDFHDTSLDQREWLDFGESRVRVRVCEVWYRHYQRRTVFLLPDGTIVAADSRNPRHQMLVDSGQIPTDERVVPTVRLSWWAGPIQLADLPSPYPHNQFPYVPFFAFREGRTKAPYGLIRRMISPQDEINARLSKMMWLLSAKRIIADSDASERPWAEVLENAARPDALILLDPNRRNKNMDAMRIETDFQLSMQQFQILKDASEAIQAAAGVYRSMLGQATTGADSGVAITSLVEQGATTLAELNDNFSYSRIRVGELLLSLIVEDMGTGETPVPYEFNGERRQMVFNQRQPDGSISNQLSALMLKISLADVPDSPTYRAQQFRNLTEVLKSLPPELQAAVAHIVVRASDLPQKEELASLIATVTGRAPPTDPAEAAAQQQQQQQQQQIADLQQQLALQQQQTQIAVEQAKAEKARAEAESIRHSMAMAEQGVALQQDQHNLEIADRMVNAERSDADREARLTEKRMTVEAKTRPVIPPRRTK